MHQPWAWTVPPSAPGSAVVKLQGPLSSLKFPGLKNSVLAAGGSRRAGGGGLVFRVKDSGSIRNGRLVPGPEMEKLPAQVVSPERGDLVPSLQGGGGGCVTVTGTLGPRALTASSLWPGSALGGNRRREHGGFLLGLLAGMAGIWGEGDRRTHTEEEGADQATGEGEGSRNWLGECLGLPGGGEHGGWHGGPSAIGCTS